ncbi:MAG: aldo/keto reductase [Candidatus Cyclobacteriaceae bacterium M3_2C_046]
MESGSNVNRRNFLKSTALGTSGLLIATTPAQSKVVKKKVITRQLGKTGIELPIVSMGVMRSDNPNLVKAALKSGVVHLDTAHVYQGGRNEEMLGKLLKNTPRKSYIISTKIKGEAMDREGNFTKDTTAEAFLEKFNISMERLGLDYVDILYSHNLRTRQAVLFEPIMQAMEQIKKEGRARFLGVSTHSNEPEVIHAAADSQFFDIVLTSYNFKQEHRKAMDEALERAASAGLGLVAMKTMAGGFLDKEKKHPVNARAALKWALRNPNIHTAIPGFTTFEQMEESLSVMENLKMKKDEVNDLQLGMNMPGLYCQGCQQCLPGCQQKLPIPDIMRSYMYTYGYKDLAKAQQELISLNLADNPCQDCHTCQVKCAKGFDIANNIHDVLRVRNIPGEFLV